MKVLQGPWSSLDKADFLKQYWQKQPVLIKNAFPDFTSPLSSDEVAGLALEEDIESRLVITEGQPPQYRLEEGPFSVDALAELSEQNWTLLVQDVDKHLPDLAEILDEFSCLPRWRIDDLMISLAARGGSVGPHVDQYDVFLLQGCGRRQWKIGKPGVQELDPNSNLRVLKLFEVDSEHELDAGDMLYLPPGVPHHGISLDGGCQTWSIGFRTPDLPGMLSDFSEWVAQHHETGRYADPDLSVRESNQGQISPQALVRVRTLLEKALIMDDAGLAHWFGAFITEPKHWLYPIPPEQAVEPAALADRLADGEILKVTSCTLITWFELPGQLLLFVNGHCQALDPAWKDVCIALAGERRIDAHLVRALPDQEEAFAIMTGLFNAGCVEWLESHD